MLRLWLDVERRARPVVSEITIFYENIGGRSRGIDPQPGGVPVVAKLSRADAEVRRSTAAE